MLDGEGLERCPGDAVDLGRCPSSAWQMGLLWAWGDGAWRRTLKGNPPQS